MRRRALLALAWIAACGGCGRLDASGLGATTDLDAEPVDSIAADAFVDADPPDTVELVDTTIAEAEPDALEDTVDALVDAADAADAGGPRFCDDTNPNLIACYRFENTEHAIQPWDDSMYGHHGTNTAVSFVAGKAGRAMSVSATSYVNVPDKSTLAVTNALTIEAWIHPRTLPMSGRVGIVDADGRYGFFILAGGFLRATAPMAIDSPMPLTTGWQHVAYTYDGSKQTLYVNGVVVKEAVIGSQPFGVGVGAGLALGMNSPNGDQLDGLLDSVRIYRSARTAMQICRAAGVC